MDARLRSLEASLRGDPASRRLRDADRREGLRGARARLVLSGRRRADPARPPLARLHLDLERRRDPARRIRARGGDPSDHVARAARPRRGAVCRSGGARERRRRQKSDVYSVGRAASTSFSRTAAGRSTASAALAADRGLAEAFAGSSTAVSLPQRGANDDPRASSRDPGATRRGVRRPFRPPTSRSFSTRC